MIEKHNDATRNRPEGHRIIDAPSLIIDLQAYTRQIKSEDAWQKNDRNSIAVLKADDMRMVIGALHKGAEMLPHRAEGMMNIQVLEGSLEINTDDITATLEPMQVLTIHKGCNYRVVAVEESVYLLTISNVS